MVLCVRNCMLKGLQKNLFVPCCLTFVAELKYSFSTGVSNFLTLSYPTSKMSKGRCPESVPALRVLHHCKNFIIVDKPYDISVNNNDDHVLSVETLVCRLFPEKIDHRLRHSFRFVHRLDMATSGVLVLGLNKRASSKICNSFKSGLVTKHYLALVRGHFASEKFTISVPIGKDSSETDVHKMCVKGKPGCIDPKLAITKIFTLEHGFYDNDPATKVLLIPVTGRTHQLRVHCQHIGHRIVGDYAYSNRTDVAPYRMMLHAYRLKTTVGDQTFDILSDDPFTPEVDPKWQPTEILTTYKDCEFLDCSESADIVKDKEPQPDCSEHIITEVFR